MCRRYFDKDKDEVWAKSDRGTEIYTRVDGSGRKYQYSHREAGATTCGHPVTVAEQEDGTLKIREVDHDQAGEDIVEQEDFLTHLKAYRGEWLWDDIQTPNGTE